MIDLIAEYSIDGETIASGGTYGLGTTVNTRQRLFEPGAGWREIDNTLAAGDYQAVGLDVSGISTARSDADRHRAHGPSSPSPCHKLLAATDRVFALPFAKDRHSFGN
ncbi:MAG: hypothetical protein Q8L45_15395 [Xanthomonadaceae bacterium]|nr:hypothetical protein [Xanthomonadaceae bacterium]MDZ4115472.1 hypothetical protein [Xanthomonadaceae bacterium]MDZ4376947.1 hypothetical protein [Xanthomonadaceae bacterium]